GEGAGRTIASGDARAGGGRPATERSDHAGGGNTVTEPLVAVDGLVKRFYINAHDYIGAINGISFRIGRGETLGLVGGSGSGKTTVGGCLLRLIEPTEGRIHFEGTDLAGASREQLRALRPRLQIVFQDPLASLNPRRTVRQAVEEPLMLQGSMPSVARGSAVLDMLERVHLGPHHLDCYPVELTTSAQ